MKRPPIETTKPAYPYSDKEEVLIQVMDHFQDWVDDNEQRSSREGGWEQITNAYNSKLPTDWPFDSKTVDPRIRTTVLEKNARLTNKPMRGKVIPREGGDVMKARLQNCLLNFQWDAANQGGSMNIKVANSDLDSRLYASKFAYVYWRTQTDKNGNLLFDGNEMAPLSIEDCGMDPNCDHVRNSKWFQHRSFTQWADLEANKDLYPGFEELKNRVKQGKTVVQSRRDSKYIKRIKQIRGLEDRMGTDNAFPVIQKVVEYREDTWITFCPDFNLILSIDDNPYDHKMIPISQLRYYSNDGDNLGDSEVEAVYPIWLAIQAILCAFLDEVIIKIRPPLKVVDGAVRTETIVYAPEAQWLMDNINAVAEVETRADSVRYFQNTYPALVSAFNVAMGDLSQGTSNIDPMVADKTATEIRQVAHQQNIRDQKNQLDLAEFIKDIMMMWMANNRQFLFRDESKHEFLLRVMGQENFEYFKRMGMDEKVFTQEGTQYVQSVIEDMAEAGQEVSEWDVESLTEAAKVPKFPVITNPKEKDVTKLEYKPKMQVSELGDSAQLAVLPEDLEGMYDYVPDVKSMESSASEQMMMARTMAIQTVTNPNVLQLLAGEGFRPKIKDMLVSDFADKGLNDAERFFEAVQAGGVLVPPQAGATSGFSPTGGTVPAQPNAGMANPPQAPTQPSVDQQMARPLGI